MSSTAVIDVARFYRACLRRHGDGPDVRLDACDAARANRVK
jgi:hypothetical protein